MTANANSKNTARVESSPTPSTTGASSVSTANTVLTATTANTSKTCNTVASTAAATAAGDDATNPPASEESLVLAYLRKHGLSDAASELQTILQNEKAATDPTGATTPKSKKADGKKRKRDNADILGEDGKKKKPLPNIDYDSDALEEKKPAASFSSPATAFAAGSVTGDVGIASISSSSAKSSEDKANTLASATGGGFGYDLDAAPTIALWGVGYAPPTLRNQRVSQMLLEGRELDALDCAASVDATVTKSSGDAKGGTAKAKESGKDKEQMAKMVNFRDEARRYIEGFTSLITWILTLPDDPANPIVSEMTSGRPPFSGSKGEKGTTVIQADDEDAKDDKPKSENAAANNHQPHQGLESLVKHALAAASHYDPPKPSAPAPQTLTLPLGATLAIPSRSSLHDQNHNPLLLPPSCKPELLALSFPLLVHTYCELLTCGLEHTARAILQTYRHLYEGSHHTELLDLEQCTSTSRIVELNDDVIAQSVLYSEMRLLNTQVVLIQPLIQKKLTEIEKEHNALKNKAKRTVEEEKLLSEHSRRLTKYTETLARSRNKVRELNSKNDELTSKLSALPFLRRARALKWNITISTASFGALSGFVSARDELLPMSALLQSRCHLIVERRDPLPFCPPALLEDVAVGGTDGDGGCGEDGKEATVRWAAPLHPVARAIEAGEDTSASGINGSEPHHQLARSVLIHSEALPFPKLSLSDGENTKDGESRTAVEFNRALLVNGFRRLEALELKQDYEAGLLPEGRGGAKEGKRQMHVADALQPSVLLATLCSNASSSLESGSEADAGAGPAAAPWIEPNIGITSASICPPDGRKVAVGCDDAAVRIWSLDRSSAKSSKSSSKQDSNTNASSLGESSMVLLGHKNGFPVFDVDWTRNGRTLLSAGGDGTVRLWDTQAVGPYGRLSNVSVQQKNNTSHTVGGVASTSLSSVVVPGSKAESLVEVGGAALSVYRGHAPSTPVWSVSSAPSGYYFASAGSDYTARIWTTDRTTPIRVLSGHVSPSVNCVAWHPNCNYVMTASDDKTCRMFDIQTGRCVRLLSGSTRGMNLVKVSPSGRYAAGSGYDGVVRIWDLGDGRLVNELRAPTATTTTTGALDYSEGLIHAMSFSACGAALAVSGEDCTVRIWDVRGSSNHLSNPDYFAATRGASATSSFSHGLSTGATKSQLDRMPSNERKRPGTRVPTKVFNTNNVAVRDLKFTKRNLLLAVGSS